MEFVVLLATPIAGALLLAFGLYTAGSALMHLKPAQQQGQGQGHEQMHH